MFTVEETVAEKKPCITVRKLHFISDANVSQPSMHQNSMFAI